VFELFVGDVGEYLANIAKQHNPNAMLLVADAPNTIDIPTHGVFYTSIGDVGHQNLKTLVDYASDVHYYPPTTWSDEIARSSLQKYYTEEILSLVTPDKVVTNLELVAQEFNYFDQDFCQDYRKSNEPQLWISGCSITAGVGVNHNDTWKYIVANELNLPMIDLSQPGSSIMWSADQICLADIVKDDVVFWGLTTHERLSIVIERKLHKLKLLHINAGSYHLYKNMIKDVMPLEILDSATLAYHNIMAIRRVYNFCKKIGAKLVILGLLPTDKFLYKFYHVPVFKQYMTTSESFKDIGFDKDGHPGPLSHQEYAKNFLELYFKFYGNTSVD